MTRIRVARTVLAVLALSLCVTTPFFSLLALSPPDHGPEIRAGAMRGHPPGIDALLRQERRLKKDDPDNFDITTAEQMVEEFRNMMTVTALVMVILGSFAGSVIGFTYIKLARKDPATFELPFGSFLGAAALAAAAFSNWPLM